MLTPDTEVGFAFGTRIGLLELGGTRLRAGAIIDWWAAENTELDVEVRDIVSGIDLWKDFGTSGWFRPYLGIGLGIHSVDVSPASGQDSLQPVGRSGAAGGLQARCFGFWRSDFSPQRHGCDMGDSRVSL